MIIHLCPAKSIIHFFVCICIDMRHAIVIPQNFRRCILSREFYTDTTKDHKQSRYPSKMTLSEHERIYIIKKNAQEDLKWRRRKLEIKFKIFFRPLTGR